MASLKLPAARSPVLTAVRESACRPKLRCSCRFATYEPETFERHARECESRSASAPVGSVLSVEWVGKDPPEDLAELVGGARSESVEESAVSEGVEVDTERIRRYVENHNVGTAIEVLGALNLPPGSRSVVEAVL